MSGSFSPCVVFTQMWLTLLVVTPVNGQHEAAQQSVVSLQPPWTTFFRGEVVTLTCYRFGFSVPQKTKWYQKRKTVKQTPGALVIKAHTLKVHESGEYWCQADSLLPSMHVNVEFSEGASARFQTHIIPASKLVFEGQLLLLNCSVKGVPGPLKFSWYKKDMLNKETKILKSSNAEFKISQVNISDAGEYYCEANNSRRSFVSRAFPITIKVPVSQPVLTLSTGKTQALEGDLMTLHCQSQRGSPCILYEFFYENVSLGNSSILSGGGAYFNFSMSTERSGNYYCTADNGLGAQCSEAIRISIFDMTKNRSVPMAAGITVGLLIMAVGVFLFYCWFSRKAGGKPTSDDSRNPSDSEPQEPTYYNVPACIELQPVYSNEPEENVIYTEVRRTQPRQKHAEQLQRRNPKLPQSNFTDASTGPALPYPRMAPQIMDSKETANSPKTGPTSPSSLWFPRATPPQSQQEVAKDHNDPIPVL